MLIWSHFFDMQNGETPLHKAAQYGILECAKILLDAGAVCEAGDEVGNLCMANLSLLALGGEAPPHIQHSVFCSLVFWYAQTLTSK